MNTVSDLREIYHKFKALHPQRGKRLPPAVKRLASSLIRNGEETIESLSAKIDVSPDAVKYWLLSKKQLTKKAKTRQKNRDIERQEKSDNDENFDGNIKVKVNGLELEGSIDDLRAILKVI